MALKGTLKDFGIAEILQLIGQQQKGGTLRLCAKDAEVSIGFREGNIVKAESAFRKKKELIGTMLVRAEIITQEQLDHALDAQKRTLQRLGDVLIASRVITQERLNKMRQLQATETLYKLFSWKSGTYEFEQGEVEFDPEAMTPLRAEAVLMEGFRMVDEWPLIRRRIPSYEMTFERIKELPATGGPGDPLAGDDGFASDFETLGEAERTLYELVSSDRDVRKLIDIASLGEFETCKALCKLVNLEYLRPLTAPGRSRKRDVGMPLFEQSAARLARIFLIAAVLLVLGALVSRINLQSISLAGASSSQFADPAAQRFISGAQMRRIEAAIQVYRLEKGPLPEQLNALVDVGLLGREDLRFPWRENYYYRKTKGGEFILLPPLR